MRSYWIWFLFLAIAWFFALLQFTPGLTEMPMRLTGSAVFFALFFLAPLFREKRGVLTFVLSTAAITAVAVLWPERSADSNPYALLAFAILAGKAVYRLHAWQSGIIGAILLLGALLPGMTGFPGFAPLFLLLFALLLGASFAAFRKQLDREQEAQARNEALLSEYRKMKRRLATDEKVARQQERTQIARDIHDSVGHKLTALLMQLEVFKLQTDGQEAEHLQELKTLAKESLEETRSAVKALKQDEAGGLSAIISLIRKLEAESFLRIQFSVKPGAFSAPLGNEQAIIVYRAVQEALTNIMRHSQAREAEIVFEAPGDSVFRFEVANTSTGTVTFREGFGLSSMQERIEQAGGQFEVSQFGGKFRVQGTLPLQAKKGAGE